MLARCPLCGAIHPLTRGAQLRLQRVQCANCKTEFDLFAALEIEGAGERTKGLGITDAAPAPEAQRPDIPAVRVEFDVEYHHRPLAPPGRKPLWPALVLIPTLTLLLALQLLLWPPVPAGQQPELDQIRSTVCSRLPCPARYPARVPGRIRVSTPDLLLDTADRLHLRFTLATPVAQPWPALDIRLGDRLGTTHGRVRLMPHAYADGAIPMQAGKHYPLRLVLTSPAADISGVEITPR